MGKRELWVVEAVHAHQAGLLAYARSFVHDDERAKEIAQECLLRLFANSGDCDAARARPWLYRVCRNLCIDALRRGKRLTLVEDMPVAVEPRERVEARELVPDVKTALLALPDRDREIVRLRFVHGLAYREIATVMDLTPNNVGVLLHHALKKMRLTLEQPPALAETSS
jgi:RNA polymerase sigma-70 factor (ECF subfamily)